MNKIISLLGKHVIELSIGSGVTLLTIVGPYYTFMAMVLWLLVTSLDMFLGATKAKYIKKNYDSSIFGLSLMKRSFILLFGCILVISGRHLASFISADDHLTARIIIGSIGTGYFHLFFLQEISSLSEHLKDIDPDNWGSGIIYKITNSIKDGIDKIIGEKLNKLTKFYSNLSPKLGKDYLRS